ncbi:Cysteine desulfurase 1 [Nymphaea thermarum]|nr:Cysteine desulfurase 1 [Nymphaea thermarum]
MRRRERERQAERAKEGAYPHAAVVAAVVADAAAFFFFAEFQSWPLSTSALLSDLNESSHGTVAQRLAPPRVRCNRYWLSTGIVDPLRPRTRPRPPLALAPLAQPLAFALAVLFWCYPDQSRPLCRLLSARAMIKLNSESGSIVPINEIVGWAHGVGANLVVDAWKSVPQMVVDVQKLGVDFLVASSHKKCGLMGTGFFYANNETLATMLPFLVDDVSEDNELFMSDALWVLEFKIRIQVGWIGSRPEPESSSVGARRRPLFPRLSLVSLFVSPFCYDHNTEKRKMEVGAAATEVDGGGAQVWRHSRQIPAWGQFVNMCSRIVGSSDCDVIE